MVWSPLASVPLWGLLYFHMNDMLNVLPQRAASSRDADLKGPATFCQAMTLPWTLAVTWATAHSLVHVAVPVREIPSFSRGLERNDRRLFGTPEAMALAKTVRSNVDPDRRDPYISALVAELRSPIAKAI